MSMCGLRMVKCLMIKLELEIGSAVPPEASESIMQCLRPHCRTDFDFPEFICLLRHPPQLLAAIQAQLGPPQPSQTPANTLYPALSRANYNPIIESISHSLYTSNGPKSRKFFQICFAIVLCGAIQPPASTDHECS